MDLLGGKESCYHEGGCEYSKLMGCNERVLRRTAGKAIPRWGNPGGGAGRGLSPGMGNGRGGSPPGKR